MSTIEAMEQRRSLLRENPITTADMPGLNAARGRVAAGGGLSEILSWLDQRVHRVEQIATSPQVMANEGNTTGGGADEGIFPDGLIIGEAADPEAIFIALNPPDPPTDVQVVTGSHFDSIYAQVSWTPPVDSTVDVDTYDVTVFSDEGATQEGSWRVGGTSFRLNNLEPNTDYDVVVRSVSAIGRYSSSVTTGFTTGIDTTIPPQVTGVTVARGATSAVVTFTPLTYAQAPDVANGKGLYEVEVDTANTFNTVNKQNIRTGDQVLAFSTIFTEVSVYARVRAIDSSGNAGPWSATAGPVTAGGVIDSMILAGLDAAKITVGFLSASRIQAGTITADKLTTSSLTTADITLNGGSFKIGNPPTTGVLINSQGIRGYASSALTFVLDQNGSATFSGTVSGASITGGTITSATMSATTITGGSISSTTLSASTITGTTINGGTITGTSISGGTVTGTSISGGSIDIGGADTTSFHVDATGNVWVGAATLGAAPFQISAAGNVIASIFKTAASGRRVEIGIFDTGDISWFGTSGTRVGQIQPMPGGNGLFFSGTGGASSIYQFYPTSSSTLQCGYIGATAGGTIGGTLNVSNLSMSGNITAPVVTATSYFYSTGQVYGSYFYGSGLTFYMANGDYLWSGGAGTFQWEARASSGYCNVRAAAYLTSSDSSLKKNIGAVDADHMEMIRSTKAKKFKWKKGTSKRAVDPPDRFYYGFIREEVPEIARDDEGYDLNGMVAIVWEALRSIDQRLAVLEAA